MASAQKPPFQQTSRVIALKDTSHQSWWQGCLPSLGKEIKGHQRFMRRKHWASSESLPCASRETSWLAWSTNIGRAAPSDKAWASQIGLKYRHTHLFLLCWSAKYNFASESVTVFGRTFPLCSSQLLNETLKEEAVQVPTHQTCQTPQGRAWGLPPHKICPGGCIWAEMTKHLTLSSIQQEP